MFAFELAEERQHPFIDAVGQQKYLKPFLAEDFEMRTVTRSCPAICRDIEDFVLAIFHTRHIVCQCDILSLVVIVRAGKAQQLGDTIFVSAVFANTFFQYLTKFFPEAVILFFLLGLIRSRQFFEHTDYAFSRSFTNHFNVT